MSLRIRIKKMLTRPLPGMIAGREVIIERPHRISRPEFIRIGDRTHIHRNAMIAPICEYAGVRFVPRIEIGSDCYIGPNLYLACIHRITIGDGSVLSEDVYINDSNHGLDPDAGLIMNQPLSHGGDVSIGKSCFLGLRSAIMPGVTLGDHCIVGIGSVVTTSFPAYSMVGGAPARLRKRYDPDRKDWV